MKHPSAVPTGSGRAEGGEGAPGRGDALLRPLAVGLCTPPPRLLEKNQDWEGDRELILAPAQTCWAALRKSHPPLGLNSQLSPIRLIVPRSLMGLLLRPWEKWHGNTQYWL